MAHIPFGYKIVDGRAVIDDEQANKLKIIYSSYLDGKGLVEAAKEAGMIAVTFAKIQAERTRRAEALGRTDLIKGKEEEPLPCEFHFNMPKKEFKDHFAQASYIYSLIESEG
jgi:hypothetical protein